MSRKTDTRTRNRRFATNSMSDMPLPFFATAQGERFVADVARAAVAEAQFVCANGARV